MAKRKTAKKTTRKRSDAASGKFVDRRSGDSGTIREKHKDFSGRIRENRKDGSFIGKKSDKPKSTQTGKGGPRKR